MQTAAIKSRLGAPSARPLEESRVISYLWDFFLRPDLQGPCLSEIGNFFKRHLGGGLQAVSRLVSNFDSTAGEK